MKIIIKAWSKVHNRLQKNIQKMVRKIARNNTEDIEKKSIAALRVLALDRQADSRARICTAAIICSFWTFFFKKPHYNFLPRSDCSFWLFPCSFEVWKTGKFEKLKSWKVRKFKRWKLENSKILKVEKLKRWRVKNLKSWKIEKLKVERLKRSKNQKLKRVKF